MFDELLELVFSFLIYDLLDSVQHYYPHNMLPSFGVTLWAQSIEQILMQSLGQDLVGFQNAK